MAEAKGKKGKKVAPEVKSPQHTEPDSRETPMSLHSPDFIETNQENWLQSQNVSEFLIEHLIDKTVELSRDKRLERIKLPFAAKFTIKSLQEAKITSNEPDFVKEAKPIKCPKERTQPMKDNFGKKFKVIK